VKFRVERDVLGEAVSWVARALPTRPVVPVLSGMLVRADADGLTLSCFDYEVSARVLVPADVGEPGIALVPGRLLAEITRSLPPSPVEVASAADMVMLTCGSAEFSLVSLTQEDYPALPELPGEAGTVDGGALATAAAQVVLSASRDDTLPMLTGVCLEIDGTSMTLAATDRYRLAVRTIGWEPAEPNFRASALVPARTLADIAKTMGPGTPVTIAFSPSGTGHPPTGQDRAADGMISFEGGGRRLTARLIGAEFIRYESRFPAEFSCSADLPVGAFTDAVRRVALVAERTSPVRLAFRPGSVVIEARSDGRARAVEAVPARFTGAEQAISFNPHYLLDGLAAAAMCAQGAEPAESGSAGTGRVRLEFTSPAKPALITWAGSEAGSGGQDNAASESGTSPEQEGQPAAGDEPRTAAFRYLVVPLRVTAAG
jgi:DNA polymerase III subunit beta